MQGRCAAVLLVLCATACLPKDIRGIPAPIEPAPEGRPIQRILLIGDAGIHEGEDLAEALALHDEANAWCLRHGCDLVLLMGDNVYEFGTKAPRDPATDAALGRWTRLPGPGDAPARTLAVLGNHDWGMIFVRRKRAEQQLAWGAAWAATEKVPDPVPGFAFDTRLPLERADLDPSTMRLVGLDTAHLVVHRGQSSQTRWMDHLQANGDAFTLLAGHHPRWSRGSHGEAGHFRDVFFLDLFLGWHGGAFGRRFDALVDALQPDVYAFGHDHLTQHGRVGDVLHIGTGAGAKTRGGSDRSPTASAAFEVEGTLDDPSLGFAWLRVGSTASDAVIVSLGEPPRVLESRPSRHPPSTTEPENIERKVLIDNAWTAHDLRIWLQEQGISLDEKADRTVRFYDTADRSLAAAGILARSRWEGEDEWDLSVKVRGTSASTLEARRRALSTRGAVKVKWERDETWSLDHPVRSDTSLSVKQRRKREAGPELALTEDQLAGHLVETFVGLTPLDRRDPIELEPLCSAIVETRWESDAGALGNGLTVTRWARGEEVLVELSWRAPSTAVPAPWIELLAGLFSAQNGAGATPGATATSSKTSWALGCEPG